MLQGESIPYRLVRSTRRRRTLSLVVSSQHGLEIRVPRQTSQHAIDKFLQQHTDWILKHRTTIHAHAATPRDKQLFFLGNALRLTLRAHAPMNCCAKEHDALVLQHRSAHLTSAAFHRRLTLWYRTEADRILRERTQWHAAQLRLHPRSIHIRTQQRRWGSCSSDKKIFLNWRLIMLPLAIIDYVIVHELTHLAHLDHSKKFWDRLALAMPDMKERKKWLKENAGAMTQW